MLHGSCEWRHIVIALEQQNIVVGGCADAAMIIVSSLPQCNKVWPCETYSVYSASQSSTATSQVEPLCHNYPAFQPMALLVKNVQNRDMKSASVAIFMTHFLLARTKIFAQIFYCRR